MLYVSKVSEICSVETDPLEKLTSPFFPFPSSSTLIKSSESTSFNNFDIVLWHLTPRSSSLPRFIPQYYANSLVVGGVEQRIIEQACKENNIMTTIGVSEKDHGSLYMAQWTINAQGETISQRRKLKPSIAERLVFGEGDVSSCLFHSEASNLTLTVSLSSGSDHPGI